MKTLDRPIPSTKQGLSALSWAQEEDPDFLTLSDGQQFGARQMMLAVSVVKTLLDEIGAPLAEMTPRDVADYCSKNLPFDMIAGGISSDFIHAVNRGRDATREHPAA